MSDGSSEAYRDQCEREDEQRIFEAVARKKYGHLTRDEASVAYCSLLEEVADLKAWQRAIIKNLDNKMTEQDLLYAFLYPRHEVV